MSAMSEGSQRISAWLDGTTIVLEMVRKLVHEHDSTRTALQVSERECAKLREEMAALRIERDRILKERNEIGKNGRRGAWEGERRLAPDSRLRRHSAGGFRYCG